MIRISELSLPVDHSAEALRGAILRRLGIEDADLLEFSVFKRSYDARRRSGILFVYSIDLRARDEASILRRLALDRHVGLAPDTGYHPVARAPAGLEERPLVVGFGPCGLFAALLLAQMGFRPIVLERGRDVRRRTQDTWALWRKHRLDPESNVQFGEGGAGLFSDGKLYSQIKDPRFLGRKVMAEFVRAGAPAEILYINKPHIGTFRLTGVVAALREDIIALGGEVRFETRVAALEIAAGRIEGVRLADGSLLRSRHVVLAPGHSARDLFRALHAQGVFMEPKAFSIGFRIEHPQSQIDRARLGAFAGHAAIGAADYKLVHHAGNGRDVYSFCMCPGGTVVAATSEPGRVVTNGMSQYSRNERNANAGIVVGITPARDFPGGPLAGVELQERLESRAFELGGGDYCAPAQRVGDFLRGAVFGIAEGARAGKTLQLTGNVVRHPREGGAGHYRLVGGEIDQIVLRVDAVVLGGGQRSVGIEDQRGAAGRESQHQLVCRRHAGGRAVKFEGQRVADLDADARVTRGVWLVDGRQFDTHQLLAQARRAVAAFGIHRLEAAGRKPGQNGHGQQPDGDAGPSRPH